MKDLLCSLTVFAPLTAGVVTYHTVAARQAGLIPAAASDLLAPATIEFPPRM
jgi:hypothetical protein